MWTKYAPVANPAAAGTNAQSPYPRSSAISIEGASRDQYDAASITPAEKPRLVSSSTLYSASVR